MKKLTKKTIASQPRFILIIDRRIQFGKPTEPFEILKLKSSSTIEAMIESEEYIDDTVYLVNIAEKSNEIIDNKTIVYNDILTNRGGMTGWHACDNNHCEEPYKYGYTIESDFFEFLGQLK